MSGRTERGLLVYAELTDRYGSVIRVQQSSLATGDCVWIFAEHATRQAREDIRERLAAAGFITPLQLAELAAFLEPSPHLNVEQATRVRDALDAFISEHRDAAGEDTADSIQAGITAAIDDAFQFRDPGGKSAHNWVTREWVQDLVARATERGRLLRGR